MLYLAPLVGSGDYAKRDAFRPRGVDGMRNWSMLDLREDPSRWHPQDRCLVWTDDSEPITGEPGVVTLGYAPEEALDVAAKQQVNLRLGISLDEISDLSAALAHLLFRGHGRWRNVEPDLWTGLREVWLHGRLWAQERAEAIQPAGVDPTDTFTYSNGELGSVSGGIWVKQSGSEAANINVTSNAIAATGTGLKLYYYNNSTATADHFSEILQVSAPTNSDYAPAVRIGPSNFSGYIFSLYSGGPVVGYFSAGAFTSLGSITVTATNGHTYRISVAGSTIRARDDGTELTGSPKTNTTLSGEANGAGIFIYPSGGSLDDWRGGDGDGSGGGATSSPWNYYAQCG